MVRSTFVRHLKKIGTIQTPDGHLQRNKGVSSYFFAPEKREELEAFLSSHMETKEEIPTYKNTIFFRTFVEGRIRYNTRNVYLTIGPDFLIVSIVRFH